LKKVEKSFGRLAGPFARPFAGPKRFWKRFALCEAFASRWCAHRARTAKRLARGTRAIRWLASGGERGVASRRGLAARARAPLPHRGRAALLRGRRLEGCRWANGGKYGGDPRAAATRKMRVVPGRAAKMAALPVRRPRRSAALPAREVPVGMRSRGSETFPRLAENTRNRGAEDDASVRATSITTCRYADGDTR